MCGLDCLMHGHDYLMCGLDCLMCGHDCLICAIFGRIGLLPVAARELLEQHASHLPKDVQSGASIDCLMNPTVL